ncbi:hypothetical protein AVEN_10593-1, partial [Araneus ventricosus]
MAVRKVRISLRNFHRLSLSVIDFSPAARAFFVRVAHPNGMGEKGWFLGIRTVSGVIVVFEAGGEFFLSLKEELRRSRILRFLYLNGLRNQRVKTIIRFRSHNEVRLGHNKIQHGKPIPKRYYRQNGGKRLVLEPDAEKLSVMPFSKEEITFEVKEANSSIGWEFEIKKGDIDFSLRFREKISEDLEPVELIPKQRIDTSFEYEKGCFKCEKIGN